MSYRLIKHRNGVDKLLEETSVTNLVRSLWITFERVVLLSQKRIIPTRASRNLEKLAVAFTAYFGDDHSCNRMQQINVACSTARYNTGQDDAYNVIGILCLTIADPVLAMPSECDVERPCAERKRQKKIVLLVPPPLSTSVST